MTARYRQPKAPVSFPKADRADGYDIICLSCEERIGYARKGYAAPGYHGHWQYSDMNSHHLQGADTRNSCGWRAYKAHDCKAGRGEDS